MANADLAFDGVTKLTVALPAILKINGNIRGNSTNGVGYRSTGTLRLVGGDSTAPLQVETMGKDVGYSFGGFGNAFSYGNLALIGAYVKLIDIANNSAGSGAEAIYVENLNVDAASVLDLNGLHLYTRSSLGKGRIING